MLDKKFTHLNIHSEYSISDSIIKIDKLAEKAKEFNFEKVIVDLTIILNLFSKSSYFIWIMN